jgi:hypothetical protein
MKSTPEPVKAYLDGLPADRREVVAKVREAILQHLPDGYQETIRWGMISYEVPLVVYPNTYNGQPLNFVGLAAQKNYYSLYLTCAYQDPEQTARLERWYKEAGKKMNMGKSCLRFRRLEDVPLEVVGEIIAGSPPEAFIRQYEASRTRGKGQA